MHTISVWGISAADYKQKLRDFLGGKRKDIREKRKVRLGIGVRRYAEEREQEMSEEERKIEGEIEEKREAMAGAGVR